MEEILSCPELGVSGPKAECSSDHEEPNDHREQIELVLLRRHFQPTAILLRRHFQLTATEDFAPN